jgi:hypothetical protein
MTFTCDFCLRRAYRRGIPRSPDELIAMQLPLPFPSPAFEHPTRFFLLSGVLRVYRVYRVYRIIVKSTAQTR